MKNIAIIGAGGHTRSSINLLRQNYPNVFLQIYDNSYCNLSNEFICDIELVGKIQDINDDDLIFLSIGDNSLREKYFLQYASKILQDNLFYSKSFSDTETFLGVGIANQIFQNVYINSFTKIGNNNIINTGAILEHETTLGSHNHISIGAILCGRVIIGNRCFIGAGSVVIDRVSICDDVILGAGSVVTKDITEPGTYVGNPARKIK